MREKGTGSFCAKHPKGRPGKRRLSPFPGPRTSHFPVELLQLESTLGRFKKEPYGNAFLSCLPLLFDLHRDAFSSNFFL